MAGEATRFKAGQNAKKAGKAGGKASGQTRRNQATARVILRDLLARPLPATSETEEIRGKLGIPKSAPAMTAVMSALIAIGVLTESGFFAAFSKKASLKQKRALSLSLLVLAIMMVVIACMVLIPNAILLSPFGTLADSPFSQGLLGIICVAIVVVGNVYGLSSGRFFSLTDTIKAHVSLLIPCLPCFLSMMLTAILKESMIYSNVIPMQSTLFSVLSWCLYLFPFAVQLLYLFKSKKKKIIS